MDIVIEEDVMVKSIHDVPEYRRQNKISTTGKSVARAAESPWTADVNSSQTSKEIENLKALILNDSEMQAHKMAFIKEAIAEGRYQSNAEKIAEKMLADMFA